KVKMQEALAKKASADNKFFASKNDLLNAEIELNSIQQDFQEKLMKTESDKFSALSLLYEGEASLTKLQNQLANYSMRKGFYYVLAPQDGYIAKTMVQGIGEIVKEGMSLCSIVPEQTEQAVELYIDPVDFPLIRKGQEVQLQFDGWPAFVFSGWPGVSYGAYPAEIVAFDRALSDNGKFRILVKNKGKKWPEAIQLGGGVEGFALLNNVPLVYELWRKANGFPPEFYTRQNSAILQTEKNK
ncbi:MAG: HlyD family efflux transporter periplasmic adaptor subunit, partial [Cytophagales bacterium]|nr:HlyD family efflux transporter periplasmic adaptor subunit [Cytophaga sp.]